MLAKRKSPVALVSALACSLIAGSASAQTITAVKLGEYDAAADNYVWQYLVQNDKSLINADLFRFTLEMSDPVLNSLITADSDLNNAPVYREVQYENGMLLTDQLAIVDFPITEGGITGLKFNDNYLDNGDAISYRLLEFRLNQDFAAEAKTVAFVAGGNVDSSTTVAAPSSGARLPEPGALALCGGVLPFVAYARRRRQG